eukprot:2558028-Amphidinium_carterae.1
MAVTAAAASVVELATSGAASAAWAIASRKLEVGGAASSAGAASAASAIASMKLEVEGAAARARAARA